MSCSDRLAAAEAALMRGRLQAAQFLLETHRDYFEAFARWGLSAGLDPAEVAEHLGEDAERVLWDVATDYGWDECDSLAEGGAL